MIQAIPGFPNYEITSTGDVRSRQNRAHKGICWLRESLNACGYRTVLLYRGGWQYRKLVHRLVLETFVGPCPKGMEGCHNNGIRTDNRLANLRWDTRSGNHRDAVKHGTAPGLRDKRGERNPRARLRSVDVTEIIKRYREGTTTQIELSERFGIGRTQVNNILCGRSWQHLQKGVSDGA